MIFRPLMYLAFSLLYNFCLLVALVIDDSFYIVSVHRMANFEYTTF